MKKLMMILVVMMVVTSCDNISTKKSDSTSKYIKSVSNTGGSITLRLTQFQGHDYVVMDGYKQGGICHSEACKCKNK
jgi:C4-type Zn-finger protein